MSDVYDTYVDKNGFERWCSNGKKVLIKKAGKWVPSIKKVWQNGRVDCDRTGGK